MRRGANVEMNVNKLNPIAGPDCTRRRWGGGRRSEAANEAVAKRSVALAFLPPAGGVWEATEGIGSRVLTRGPLGRSAGLSSLDRQDHCCARLNAPLKLNELTQSKL